MSMHGYGLVCVGAYGDQKVLDPLEQKLQSVVSG